MPSSGAQASERLSIVSDPNKVVAASSIVATLGGAAWYAAELAAAGGEAALKGAGIGFETAITVAGPTFELARRIEKSDAWQNRPLGEKWRKNRLESGDFQGTPQMRQFRIAKKLAGKVADKVKLHFAPASPVDLIGF
jgi:hypothetical protein